VAISICKIEEHDPIIMINGKQKISAAVKWDLWDAYFSFGVGIAHELNSITQNMEHRMQQDVPHVRMLLWERVEEKLTNDSDDVRRTRNLQCLAEQKKIVQEWLADMTSRDIPRRGWYRFEATGVSKANKHAVSIMQSLEELRVLAVCADQLEGIEQIEAFGADVLDWLEPGGSAMEQLRLQPQAMERYAKMFVENVADVNLFEARDPKDRSKKKAAIALKPLKEWKMIGMMKAIFKGFEVIMSKEHATELVNEMDFLLHGTLKITFPMPEGVMSYEQLLALEKKLPTMQQGSWLHWDSLKKVERIRAGMAGLRPWTISYKVSQGQHGSHKRDDWSDSLRDKWESIRQTAMKKVLSKAEL